MSILRVMSFNVAGSFDDDEGENAWHAGRSALNVRVIQRYAPHIIGFQEVQSGNFATYQAQLPQYEYVLGAEADVEPYLYNAIAWDPHVCALVASGAFWLSKTPEQYSGDWDTTNVHVANWVKLQHHETGTVFVFLNTHLDHISEQARIEGTKLILQKLAQLGTPNLPVIVSGDFNCNPWVPEYGVPVETTFTDACYHIFKDHGFVDTYVAGGNTDSLGSNTYHGYEGQQYSPVRHHMAWRIDWILTLNGQQRIQTQSCTIIHDHAAPIYPSDHYPLLAELSVVN